MRLAFDACKRFNAGALRTYRILEQATRVCEAEGRCAQEAINELHAVMQDLETDVEAAEETHDDETQENGA